MTLIQTNSQTKQEISKKIQTNKDEVQSDIIGLVSSVINEPKNRATINTENRENLVKNIIEADTENEKKIYTKNSEKINISEIFPDNVFISIADLVYQFDGEIYSTDSLYVEKVLKTAINDKTSISSVCLCHVSCEEATITDNIFNNEPKNKILACLCLLKKVIEKLEEQEGEYSIAFLYKNKLFFATDWLGRVSLKFSHKPFSVSIKTGSESCKPNFLYMFNFECNVLFTVRRDRQQNKTAKEKTNIDFPINGNEKNIQFDKILKSSISRRLMNHHSKKAILFSGGADSLLLTVILHHQLPLTDSLYLINTSFKKNCWDRKNGLLNYQKLTEKFPNRDFVFIDNLITESETERELIKTLIYPKTTNMDINIATCLFYSCRATKEISDIVFIGSGADELFGGYNLYKRDLVKAKDNMRFDVLNLWDRNMFRDNGVFSYFGLQVRMPYLDKQVVNYAFELDIGELISHNALLNPSGSMSVCEKKVFFENKLPIRNLLKFYGFTEAAALSKKAMQFGSGLRDIERSNNSRYF
ncbi:Asparagine synthetase domain-containing protein [Cucumispora dikerogammari]|nr:Asparagine synthetase domain-containing protein [Cucumispora dikerogammari]